MRPTNSQVPGRSRRATVALGAVVLTALAGCTLPNAGAGQTPTTRPASGGPAPSVGVAEARRQLAELPVAVRGVLDGYDRDKKYPHWKTVSGGCDVREEVLKRDGVDVVVKVNDRCAPVSGTWHSAYDDSTWTKPSDVDIDHMVPLAQSWVSGAKNWTQDKREQFANDLIRPQLFVVTDTVNQSKGDKAPDQWKPPQVSFWCTYATDWIVVKHHYELTITVPERTALSSMLDRC